MSLLSTLFAQLVQSASTTHAMLTGLGLQGPSGHMIYWLSGFSAGRQIHTSADLDNEMIILLYVARSLNYPHIHKLPVEVLTHIFLDCLPDLHHRAIAPSDAPIVFTRICTHWRSIALNTPRLWSSVLVDSRRAPDAAAVDAWVGHAGSKPLTVELRHLEPKLGFEEDYDERLQALKVQGLFTPLISWSHRWRDVTIDLHPPKLHITSDFFNSELPQSDLEDLELKMFSDAPNLTEHKADDLGLLIIASELVTCEFLDVSGGWERPLPKCVTLSALQTFALQTATGEPCDPFILEPLYFSMPALRRLVLTTTPPFDAADYAWFLPMLAGASSLRAFERSYDETDTDAEDLVVACLQAAPQLTDIAVTPLPGPLTAIMCLLSSREFLPNLTKIHLGLVGRWRWRRPSKYDDTDVVQLYEAVVQGLVACRDASPSLPQGNNGSGGVSQIRSFRLTLPGGMPIIPSEAVLEQQLRELGKGGMDLSFCDAPFAKPSYL
ncbi:hypothetical protein C8J57DRAFT_1526017 [Mycena rebaudengoi]|nr:hypothetical protein C8J57DRAFT_1526017 [Mycena rebaudengoi]